MPFPRPSTRTPSRDSRKLLRRLPGKLPGKLGVLGGVPGELLRGLPGDCLCSEDQRNGTGPGSLRSNSPGTPSSTPSFPDSFPGSLHSSFSGIPARGSCRWSGNKQGNTFTKCSPDCLGVMLGRPRGCPGLFLRCQGSLFVCFLFSPLANF